MAALVPLSSLSDEKRNNVVLGIMEGAFEVPDNFDDPLTDEILDEFYPGLL